MAEGFYSYITCQRYPSMKDSIEMAKKSCSVLTHFFKMTLKSNVSYSVLVRDTVTNTFYTNLDTSVTKSLQTLTCFLWVPLEIMVPKSLKAFICIILRQLRIMSILMINMTCNGLFASFCVLRFLSGKTEFVLFSIWKRKILMALGFWLKVEGVCVWLPSWCHLGSQHQQFLRCFW